ncbi:hypothetical protein [Sphingomonas jatrophae]|uniref:Uncharacterized protein n=1 Tax=Sphingomonas jatrophae TaxID=1166337 RepID=A0A1I6M7L0_9SPHN|nr:hypothetical protein [Sphingomonas jatrophae]SFS11686.1 hypothetical protein SAMN05192580_3623 [Sphingomonas jatrophae]
MKWFVERTSDNRGYQLTGSATYARGYDEWHQPTALLTDARGCITSIKAPATQDVGSKREWVPAQFSGRVAQRELAARAVSHHL